MTKTPVYKHTESCDVHKIMVGSHQYVKPPDTKHNWKLIDIKLVTLNDYQYFIYTWESID